ncbi:restriction endonuclease subunit S [Lactobacillus mulieris]|uniref:restriction endonuclease subunit S n=1 Tax=Lactobacillus mulieris TaxID=2508708 RepID=UPI0022AC3916|nr:restriction endonuclease subunit S [Lactobacillus mulieris]MCZ3740823.1 restriction endonuclease subunit S [Lactobacillus mulieris]MCZ3747661.1 restriction endonuclease subunit S [Lactobacillus mulieris]MCZ3749547.1 restriction endonuclease subunit S [Lactobacillus mulieris]
MNSKDGIKRGPFGSSLKKSFFVKKSDYVVYEQQNAIYDQFSTRYFINEVKYNELEAFSLKPNDFILSGSGTIGCISLVPDNIKKGVINQALIRIRINQNITNKFFFLQWMRSSYMQRRLTQANPGSAITNLVPISEIKNWKVTVPNNKIQKHIGKILTQLDTLLSLQQRKLELESLLYKHLKRNCFYNNYNFYYSKPKKLNIKMKDIITLEDNQRIPVSENNRKKGITPYYGANGIQDYVDGYTHVGQYILIAEDGASDIQNYPVIAVNGKVWINNHAHVLKVNKTVDFSYLLYFLKNFNYFPWLVGSGRFKLNAKTLLNIKISIDSNTENQRKIGVLLNECDSLTHATSTRIKLIKDIKQFLLQNLFI